MCDCFDIEVVAGVGWLQRPEVTALVNLDGTGEVGDLGYSAVALDGGTPLVLAAAKGSGLE
jgi:hypothetical protein